MSILSKPYFHDEAEAFRHVESVLWTRGSVCPHCQSKAKHYRLKNVMTKPSRKHPEGKVRHGLWKCKECRKQFTVRIGTIFEESHLELHKWLQAIYLMVSSKKGISAHQMHRTLEITYKTAWFLCHRIREAMREGSFDIFGSGGGSVEIDETFIGTEPGAPKRRGYGHKMKVLTLVDRDSKRARSIVVDDLRPSTLAPIVSENVSKEARVLTDQAQHYKKFLQGYAGGHERVNHGIGEYVSFSNPEIHTQTVESYYSVFKRGMKGVYQHCAKKHLHRYMAEFDFRYNNRIGNGVNDFERAMIALSGISGKRLTYRSAH
ncbi:MAG: IS1595 family transposase [Ponticaulis sp.]|nr:IS1595 family transposase [Ponticaulis sp.]